MRVAIATPDDAPGIYTLQRQTWLATYPNPEYGITKADIEEKFPINSAEGIQRKRSRLESASDSAREWIAVGGDKVVGWAVGLKKDGLPYLGALYVLPSYQRKGVGAQLMATAMEWLGSELDITLDVAAYNQKAIHFYESWGFTIVGPNPDKDSILPNGKRIPSIQMIRLVKNNGV